MFDFGRKKEWQHGTFEQQEITTATASPLGEDLQLKEYISIDSIKAHLVDVLEENRRLREEKDRNDGWIRRERDDYKKKYELAQISADEYKKRLSEEQEKSDRLKRELEVKDRKMQDLEKKCNDLIVEKAMAAVEEEATADIPVIKTKTANKKRQEED